MKRYTLSRREFLAQMGLVTAGTMLAACAAPAGPGAGAPAAAPGADAAPVADREIAPGVMRSETLILENPTGKVVPADDFNRCAPVCKAPRPGCSNWG